MLVYKATEILEYLRAAGGGGGGREGMNMIKDMIWGIVISDVEMLRLTHIFKLRCQNLDYFGPLCIAYLIHRNFRKDKFSPIFERNLNLHKVVRKLYRIFSISRIFLLTHFDFGRELLDLPKERMQMRPK